MIIVVCGVSGCGKTSTASALSKLLNVRFADADDYHSEANKALMRAGIGLNDSNRLSWLKELRSLLLDWHRQRLDGVLACSALRQKYRHLLNSGLSYDDDQSTTTPAPTSGVETDMNGNVIAREPVDLGLVFVLLNVQRETIEQRLRMRRNHDIVRDVSILDSQFSTLEMPSSNAKIQLDHKSGNNNNNNNNNDENNNEDNTGDDGSYLCREKSDRNHTSYLIYAFKCSSEKSVDENARDIVQILPTIQQYLYK